MTTSYKELKNLENRSVLGMRVDATSYQDAVLRIINWAKSKKSIYVCAANVHMTMQSWDDVEFRSIINNSALVTPDGMPLVWALKGLGIKYPSRVYGPTLTLRICEIAAKERVPIALYGGTPQSLQAFTALLKQKFPQLKVVCQISPPFRPITPGEDDSYVKEIVGSGAQILFVGIGCPKQEYWMAAHQDLIPAVMVGVGAAFDFYSGRVKQAPSFLQKMGLEWAFRLFMEPRRLWKRYVYNNPRFIILFLFQWISSWFGWYPYQTKNFH